MTNPAATTHAHKTSAYSEKLKDPRWQKKRLEVFERDGFKCRSCKDEKSTLHVHHLSYEKDKDPWDYDIQNLMTLCESCHEMEREERALSERYLLSELKEKGFLYQDIIGIQEMIHDLSMGGFPFLSWATDNGVIEIRITRITRLGNPAGDQE